MPKLPVLAQLYTRLEQDVRTNTYVLNMSQDLIMLKNVGCLPTTWVDVRSSLFVNKLATCLPLLLAAKIWGTTLDRKGTVKPCYHQLGGPYTSF